MFVKVVRKRLRVDSLTSREKVVLQFLATGRTYKEIAHDLSISVNTVQTHVKSIYAKLGVRSRTEAAITFWRQHEGSGQKRRRKPVPSGH